MSANADFLAENFANFGEPRFEQKNRLMHIDNWILLKIKYWLLQMNFSGKLEFVLILLELCRMKRHTAANVYLQASFLGMDGYHFFLISGYLGILDTGFFLATWISGYLESKTESYSKGPTLFGLCCILCHNF